MNNLPDPFAVRLRGDLEPLVERLAARLRAQVPWYQAQAPPLLREMVRQDCQVLAEALATNEIGPLRLYVEEVGRTRLRAGAPAPDLIVGISLLEEEMRPLLLAAGDDPAGVSDGTRRLQNLIRNMRMILSGVNLRLLTEEPSAPGADAPGRLS